MIRYAIATGAPVALLVIASFQGGGWCGAALLSMTVMIYAVDRLAATSEQNGSENDGGGRLLAVLAVAHFVLLALSVWAVSGRADIGLSARILLFLGYGIFFGQISNSVAHELIHRGTRGLNNLGRGLYISLLFGHHISAHLRVHHPQVATRQDPNSARWGESIYRFWPRAWLGSFRAGYKAELRMSERATSFRLNPYFVYTFGAVVTLAVAYALADVVGVLVLLGLAGYAQMQLLMSDYVQHYGLRRETGPDGKTEPLGPQHSWNSPHIASSAMMVNAPRHSDHHLNPSRPFPALELNESRMPILPYPMPMMALIALWPGLWRNLMHPRLEALQDR